MIKNDLYLRALKGEIVERPPVWMMRQAGRFLPEFREIRDQYDFFTRCRTPELASEITLQPYRRFGMDATILFSDILVIPQAMNIEVEMKEGTGPWLPNPIRTQKDVDAVIVPDVTVELKYVMDAIKITKQMLNNEVVCAKVRMQAVRKPGFASGTATLKKASSGEARKVAATSNGRSPTASKAVCKGCTIKGSE